MKKLVILYVFVFCLFIPRVDIKAEDNGQEQQNHRLPKRIIVRPSKPDESVKRKPPVAMVIDCMISDCAITFLNFLSEDGFQVEIESIDGSQWSGLVSPESPSIAFDGEGGVYTIVCTTLDGRVYEGEFEL